MSSNASDRYMDFMEGAGDSFVESGGGTPSITPEDIDVVGFAGGSVMGGSRGIPSITPEDIDVVGFAGGSIGGGAGATKIISNEDMGVRGFADVGSMMPNPEIEMISALGQIAAKGQYGELLNAVKDMPANIAGVTDAINNGDMRSLGSTVANAVFAAAGAKAKTGMAQGALAAAKNIISPKAIEATAAAQARMPSMAMSLGAAPAANLSAADKAKAALAASKRSAAQPITLGAVAGCSGNGPSVRGDGRIARGSKPDTCAEDQAFEKRMQEMLKTGNAGAGHELTYKEAIWWWRNANGKTLTVDGRELSAINLGGEFAAPFPLGDLKVHGHVTTNPANGRIYDGMYDFEPRVMPNPNNQMKIKIRNILNEAAIKEHGAGTPFEIQYRYEDGDFD